jgi:tetratricopeptide (TPR) repeat protein
VWAAVCLVALAGSSARAGQIDPVVEGFQLLEAGHVEGALKKFKKALKAQPESAEIRTYVGLGNFKLGNFEEALEAFDQARVRDASLADSALLFYRASCLRALGLARQERDAWQAVIEWDPRSRFARQAQDALRKPGNQSPPDPETLIENGLSHWQDKPLVAAAYLNEAVGLQDSPSSVVAYLAAAFNQAGDYQSVIDLGDHHRVPETQYPLWQIQLAVARMGLEQWDGAKSALQEVPDESRWGRKARYLQALCLLRLGESDQARALLKTFTPGEIPDLEQDLKALLRALNLVQPEARQPM